MYSCAGRDVLPTVTLYSVVCQGARNGVRWRELPGAVREKDSATG